MSLLVFDRSGPMTALYSQILGISFVVVAVAATLLMFHLWGFPYDKEKLTSTAPPRLMNLHRLLGYIYIALYATMMWSMVPRMWTYQVELPARTVAHLVIGLFIGAVLVLKVVVVRFFRHLEGTLAPFLGSALFIATLLLVSLALPFSLRESLLQRSGLNEAPFGEDRLERVRTLLPMAGLDDEEKLAELATVRGLIAGREVLRSKCVQCHDLRTVVARPRTPSGWRSTVHRMAERSTVLSPITPEDEWAVTAYLIAITPTLQATAQLLRREGEVDIQNSDAALRASAGVMEVPYDSTEARKTFERSCSQCHSPTRVQEYPLEGMDEVATLVQRMVGNGLRANETELANIIRYVFESYSR